MLDVKKAAAEGLISVGVEEMAKGLLPVVPAALAGAGAICGVVAAFFLDEVVAPIRDHWWLFLVCAAVFFLLGIAAGAKIYACQIKKAAEKERASNDEDRIKVREAFMQYPIWVKAMVKAAFEKDAIYCSTEEWGYTFEQQGFVRNVFKPETLPGGKSQLRPSQELTSVYDALKDLLECVTEDEMNRYRLVDKTKSLTRRGSSRHGLTWWWYADDYSKKDKDEFARLARITEARKNQQGDEPLTVNVFDDAW